MRARQCRRCPATFPAAAVHCPQCGNCDYVTIIDTDVQAGGAEVAQKTTKRNVRGRVKAVA